MSGSKCKSSVDIHDTAKKRFTGQEMAREFSLFEETVSFWTIGPICRKVYKGCRNCSECNPVLLLSSIMCYYPDIIGSLFQGVHRTEFSREQGSVPPTLDMSQIADCVLPPTADNPSTPLFLISSLSSSQ